MLSFLFVIFLVVIPLLFVVRFVIRNQRTIGAVYKAQKRQKQARREAEEERERQERVRRRVQPEQSTVDLIQDANRDLEGGEYVDFEEVSEE